MQQHGCRVVQAIIQTAADAGMDVSHAVEGVVAGGLEQLALHRFANYAVQVRGCRALPPLPRHALPHTVAAAPRTATAQPRTPAPPRTQVALRQCTSQQREGMLSTLLPRLLAISTSKHGSNVAEVVLSLTSAQRLERIADSIFGSSSASADALRQLMEHQFGNYVLQTLLRRLTDPQKRASAIAKVRAATTTSNFGRSVLSRLGEAEAQVA